MFAHALLQKGIDDKRFALDCIVENVLWLGYNKVLVKSDNELAIVKLLSESLATLKVEGLGASEEHPPPYDSQANGAVEATATQVRSRMKTMKMCLERRIGKRLPPRHPITAWLVAHCAAVIRFRVRGVDDKTLYERARMCPSAINWYTLQRRSDSKTVTRRIEETNTSGIRACSSACVQ